MKVGSNELVFFGKSCSSGPHNGEGCNRYVKSKQCVFDMRVRLRKYQSEHVEEIRIKKRAYRQKHPENNWNYKMRFRYRLSREEFDSMIVKQNGKCAICRLDMTKPHIDHDHVTGKIRGLLCRTCNIGLGMFRDSDKLLLSGKRYLEEQCV